MTRHARLVAVAAPAALGAGIAEYAVGGAAALWTANAAWTLAGAAALAGALYARARPAEETQRRTWGYLVAACGCWLAGQLAWDAYSLRGAAPGVPSVADLFRLAFAALALVGLTRISPAPPRVRRLAALDVVSLVLAAGLIGSVVWWHRAAASDLPVAGKASALAYSVLYIGAATSFVQALFRRLPILRHPDLLLLLAGVGLEAAAFVGWTPLLLERSYAPGRSPIDLLWTLGMLTIGAAGLLAPRTGPVAPRDEHDLRRGALLPATAFLALLSTLAELTLDHGALGPRLAVEAGLLAGGTLFLFRAWLVSGEVVALAQVERETHEELDRFFALAPELLCVLDSRGGLVRANPAFSEALGRSEGELLGAPLTELVHPDDRPPTLEALDQMRAGQRVVALENRCRRSDGSYRWLRWNAASTPGSGTGYAAAQDVTDRKEAQLELERLAARLERSNRDLDAFAYTASHDLKSPLVSIGGFASSLETRLGPDLDERSRLYLERIQANVLSMQRLIGDLFELARIGIEADEPSRIDPNPIVAELVESLAPRVEETGGRIAVTATLPLLEADPTHFRQAIGNLLENALAHGRGTAPLHVFVSGGAANGHVEVAVQDNGPGIPEPEREKMFELFQRGRSAHEHEPDGTGIGLALVKKATESSGGSVRYEDAPGHGARFVLTFPKGDAT